jgi:agmatinase
MKSYAHDISAHPSARVCLLGLPHDENSSFMRGAAGGPSAIRAALFSGSSNLWTETGLDLGRPDHLMDAGDVVFDGRDDFGEIVSSAGTVLSAQKLPIFLGGDHFVTWPVVRGIAESIGDLTILHLDAHGDLYEEFDGSRTSHACPFARIMEEGLARRLVQVGIRSMTGHLREQAEKYGVEVHEMKDFAAGLSLGLAGPLYISFDLDVLDPGCAPGVSHPEGGGLTTREAISIIHGITVPIVGADVVEMNPVRDPGEITAYTAAKIVKEIAGMMLSTSPGR